jgi:hypothetical protein
MNKLTQKQCDEILTEQFRRAGHKYEPSVCKKPGWFRKYQWSKEAELEFADWLIKYFRKHKLSQSNFDAKNMAQFWCFNYGWRYKLKNEI